MRYFPPADVILLQVHIQGSFYKLMMQGKDYVFYLIV